MPLTNMFVAVAATNPIGIGEFDGATVTFPAAFTGFAVDSGSLFHRLMTMGPGGKLYWYNGSDGTIRSWDGVTVADITAGTPSFSVILELLYDPVLDRLYASFAGAPATTLISYWNGTTWTNLPDTSALVETDGSNWTGSMIVLSDGTFIAGHDSSPSTTALKLRRLNGTSWDLDVDFEASFGVSQSNNAFIYNLVRGASGEMFALFRDNVGGSADKTVFKRNSGGSWSDVSPVITFGSVHVTSGVYWSNALYVGAAKRDSPFQSVILRYDGSTWSTDLDVVADGAPASAANAVHSFAAGTNLYAGLDVTSGQTYFLKRTPGGVWSHVSTGSVDGPSQFANAGTNVYTLVSISDCTAGDVRGGDRLRITLTAGAPFDPSDVHIVNFDSTDVEATFVSTTVLEVTTPPHNAGTINPTLLRVQANLQDTLPSYTYAVLFPVIYSISPASGPLAGGTSVTITGTNFQAGATVRFNGTLATSIVVVNPTTITCVTPAHVPGPVDVTVINP
jgi:hypothetical protein